MDGQWMDWVGCIAFTHLRPVRVVVCDWTITFSVLASSLAIALLAAGSNSVYRTFAIHSILDSPGYLPSLRLPQ